MTMEECLDISRELDNWRTEFSVYTDRYTSKGTHIYLKVNYLGYIVVDGFTRKERKKTYYAGRSSLEAIAKYYSL